MLGLNVTENIAMTPMILSRLAAAADSSTRPMSVLDDRGTRSVAANPLIRVLEDAMRFYFEFHFDQGEGYLAHLHDPLAAAVALDPDLVQTRPATVDVELTGTLTRGMTIADWNGRWGRAPNALVGVDVDPAAFFERFIARVGAFAQRLTGLLVDAFDIPAALSVTQQQGLCRLPSSSTCARAVRPSPRMLGIPPPFVDRPWPGPPGQPPVTAGHIQAHRLGREHPPAGHPHRIALGINGVPPGRRVAPSATAPVVDRATAGSGQPGAPARLPPA